jgi:hypothetical protein
MMALEYVFLAIHILGWVRVSSVAIGVVLAMVFIVSLVLISLGSDAATALRSARKDRR